MSIMSFLAQIHFYPLFSVGFSYEDEVLKKTDLENEFIVTKKVFYQPFRNIVIHLKYIRVLFPQSN